ncbi:serpin family protein [Gorillibacterium massiliense]|uniref:serpin family protein n=1 Tax=Gorillibacterium massiliense TaxID=1280390 RepID=UPI0004B27797|nr:serpin family protein [Gorillibacterium massiliense]
MEKTWRKWTVLAVCLAFVIALVAFIPHGSSPSDEALPNVAFPKAYAFDDVSSKSTVIEGNPVDETFLSALNGFSYKTAAQIFAGSSSNGNYSPLSLYYALALAATGAGGKTADEILALLDVSDPSTLSMQSGNLYRQLYTDNQIGKLKIANSLWMDKDIHWKKDFIQNAAENFYASSFSMDFSDKKTGEVMAKWVVDHLNGTLKPELKLEPDQILSLINTVYFCDEWTDRFDKDKTEKDNFKTSDGTTIISDFMNGRYASSGFTKGEGFRRSSLGLKNAGRMVFILPDEGISPRELLSTPEKVKAVFESGKESYSAVLWKIPKFSFDTNLSLADTLKKVGVTSAFEHDADFSGITDHMAFISDVHQETHIGIDENGVEASAFTELVYAGSGFPVGKADMILNRPFIYGILAPNGTLLFIGICESPTGNS